MTSVPHWLWRLTLAWPPQPDRSVVYATAWTEPPGLAAYRITNPSLPLSLINTVTTRARSGYCCNSAVAVYSAGGPTGEVFAIDSATGGFKDGSRAVVQELNFVDQDGRQRNDGSVMDFGGLRSVGTPRLHVACGNELS